ncbi:hypothetical protein HBP45_03205 [Listeria welshimeri]|nr:hypothetical protein [Listeria welshimeri]MBC2331750.1 hypothetical protein [Listeria welshimeri]
MNFFKQLVEHTEAKTVIWGKETTITMDETIILPEAIVNTKLAWIENNKENIIQFALEAEDFLYNFNNFISKEINKNGKFKLPDGTLLTETIEVEKLEKSIFIDSVSFYDEVYFNIDLGTIPDYFGGNLLSIEISVNDYEMEFTGMNG